MLLRPTRVHEKFGGYHISAHVPTKNAPGFALPNRDAPKTHPVLGANPCRGVFRGVCNTPLHGYVKNPAGFIFPHTDTPKTHPVLGLNLRRETFWGVCNTPLHGYMKNLAGSTFPYPDTPKTRPVLEPNLRRRTFSGRMLLRPYTGTCKTWRVSYFRTRIRQKRTRFHLSQ